MPTTLGYYSAGGEEFSLALANLAAMVNERNLYCGLTGFTQANQEGLFYIIDLINTLRYWVENCCTRYLKYSTHPTGDLSGLTSYTRYSGIGQALQDAGVGGMSAFGTWTWTNVPADGSASDLANFAPYYPYLSAGVDIYAVWYNEILAVCRVLNWAWIQGGWQSVSGRHAEGEGHRDAVDPLGCGGVKNDAEVAWNACAFTPTGLGAFAFSEGGSHLGRYSATAGIPHSPGKFDAWVGNQAGKAQCALALVPGGTPRLFLKIDKPRPLGYGTDSPPYVNTLSPTLPVTGCTAFGQYGEWTGHGVTVGNSTPSIELPDCDTKEPWATSCSLTTRDTIGFAAQPPVVIINPDFQYL